MAAVVVKSNPEQAVASVLAKLEAVQIPIPIEQIIKADGIALGRNRSDGLEASFIINHANQWIIGVNSATSPRRQRFAIAHAYGHQRLHPTKAGRIIICHSVHLDGRAGPAHIATDAEEAQANHFAGALLMPREPLMAALSERLKAADFASRDELIAQMANAFEVSREAMGWRLIGLNVITG